MNRGDFVKVTFKVDDFVNKLNKELRCSNFEVDKEYPAIVKYVSESRETSKIRYSMTIVTDDYYGDFCIYDNEIKEGLVSIKDVTENIEYNSIPNDLDSINITLSKLCSMSNLSREMKNHIYDIETKQIELVSERLKPLIGHYFKTKDFDNSQTGYVFMITNVPKPRLTMMDRFYEPTKIPAIRVSKNSDVDKCLQESTIYSIAYRNGIDYIYKEYTEITKSEFMKYCHNIINGFFNTD